MKVIIASDHGGVNLKKEIYKYLEEMNYQVIDESILNDPTDDYPDFAQKVCEEVKQDTKNIGILICTSGIGMSIAANKIKGIYCGVVNNLAHAKFARLHNGCNVIALDGEMDIDLAKDIVLTFINTDTLDDQRHIRRVNKIKAIEEEN